MQISVRGHEVIGAIDGVETVRYTDTTNLMSGLIGLQFREGPIAFRDIRIKPMTRAIIPGDGKEFGEGVNLQVDRNNAGHVQLTGGRGHLEWKGEFGNGVIQFCAKTIADNVNSGLFFRCIPGEDMNGYECQLHHGFKETRTSPIDSGTGAIFRRQPARVVLSDADQDAYVTIVADGPHFATWVQGVQVVDWTDTRPENANPRKGYRAAAGSIMLQGHDPGCVVLFKQFAIGQE
jgi:hypothetical protein